MPKLWIECDKNYEPLAVKRYVRRDISRKFGGFNTVAVTRLYFHDLLRIMEPNVTLVIKLEVFLVEVTYTKFYQVFFTIIFVKNTR